jgi:hypothetical protein
MTKKRWIVQAMLEACAFLTLVVLALLSPEPGVTKADFERIEDGMTRAEVEDMLSGTGKRLTRHNIIISVTPRTKTYIIVYFDDADRIIGKVWGPPENVWAPAETFLQKLRRLLHL